MLLLLFVVTPRCQSVSKKKEPHGRCELREEQEKNAGTGFNGVAFGISFLDESEDVPNKWNVEEKVMGF